MVINVSEEGVEMIEVHEEEVTTETTTNVPSSEVEAKEVTPIDAEITLKPFEAEVKSEIEGLKSKVAESSIAIDELKKSIDDLSSLIKTIEEKAKNVASIVEALALWKCSRCVFYKDGICTAWRISDEFARVISNVFGDYALEKDGDIYRIKVKNAYIVGAICPLFKVK